MGRAPCCDKANVKKDPWSLEEDEMLKDYIQTHGTGGNWITLPQRADDEDEVICTLFASIGSSYPSSPSSCMYSSTSPTTDAAAHHHHHHHQQHQHHQSVQQSQDHEISYQGVEEISTLIIFGAADQASPSFNSDDYEYGSSTAGDQQAAH
ncbi:hypothetical protein E3N88_13291 [Mikania micrantha]|uniref:Myb-like domain-containing protein n=1 Tax=Mikania micrantha TaxID=192012 RepID=A0A5N6P9S6_9ASTR|nr:hypothetical protein E3N88_13291 [Mikania micrantha]